MSAKTIEISNDSFSFKFDINGVTKEDIKNAITEQIIKNTASQENIFNHLPTRLKLASIFAFLASSYFSVFCISQLSNKNKIFESSALTGFNKFNGQGGFLHDVLNFFPYFGRMKKDWINDNPRRFHLMILSSVAMVVIIHPLLSDIFDTYSKKADSCEKYVYFFKGIVTVAQGLSMTIIAVFFGMAMNYFINITIKKKFRREKEKYELMKNQSIPSLPTKQEVFLRLKVFFLSIVITISISYLEPILKQKMLFYLNPVFYSYFSLLLISISLFLGLQCLGLRILMPMFKKISLYLAYQHDGDKNKLAIILFAILFYIASILFFILAAYINIEKFNNPIIHNLIFATYSSIGIGFNIIGCQFIFMSLLLFVNSRDIVTRSISDTERYNHKAQQDIKNNKIIGSILIFGSIAIICSIISIIIYSEFNNLGYLDKILENYQLIPCLSICLSLMIFSGIAIYGKSAYIEDIISFVKKTNLIDETSNIVCQNHDHEVLFKCAKEQNQTTNKTIQISESNEQYTLMLRLI